MPKANEEPAPLVHIQVCSLRGFGWRSLAPGSFPVTTLCWSRRCININQPQVHVCPLSPEPPSTWGILNNPGNPLGLEDTSVLLLKLKMGWNYSSWLNGLIFNEQAWPSPTSTQQVCSASCQRSALRPRERVTYLSLCPTPPPTTPKGKLSRPRSGCNLSFNCSIASRR